MSIYATLWSLKFPRCGDDFFDGEWIRATAQGVPWHIGTPTSGHGYETATPTRIFYRRRWRLTRTARATLCALWFVTEETKKGTSHAGQEYQDPLLVLTGREYADSRFDELHTRIWDALKGRGPRIVAQSFTPHGGSQLILSDGRVIGTVGHKARAKIRVKS